ncbi:MAG: NAD-dependent epimerase/dehydratase family protein [Betaproteobacteria bacterium]|nr:NAD-dependent epimerase/dehydratase family protein [Betaproteobacteria bacterium]
MDSYLVTGPTGFLGYHVIKRLNADGIRPRVLIPIGVDANSPALEVLKKQDVMLVEGDINDLEKLQTACKGIDIILHLHFAISLAGGEQTEKLLHENNVLGTRNLFEAAIQEGVSRIVVSSSALAVGLNDESEPLDEEADWEKHSFSLPYALSRRDAEQHVLTKTAPGFPEVVVVNPSFTLGPEDWGGTAPANKLVMRMSKPGFHITAPIGFGVLDVRDYAKGVLLAVAHGIPGHRYILSGHNITPDQLAGEVAKSENFERPKWQFSIRAWMIAPVIAILIMWSKITGKPARVVPSILELWGRYAWYDTRRALVELGWKPRPLQETLHDTIHWHQEPPVTQKS